MCGLTVCTLHRVERNIWADYMLLHRVDKVLVVFNFKKDCVQRRKNFQYCPF